MNGEKIIAAMSGGVDSSVAAHLLVEQGFEVCGMFMKNWEEDDSETHCTARRDREDAESVCDKLGIEFRTVNFAHEYWERVFREILRECEAGRTPNPDVLCNREIKFHQFLLRAEALGAGRIATGHYARRNSNGGGMQLLRGADRAKDQSYFLHAVHPGALARTLFPLGGMSKGEVRAIARKQNFRTHDKKDSTGICFIGERNFRAFLARYLPPRPGDFVSLDDGAVLGEHAGLMFYTLGQRHGLGIGGAGAAWYVARKNTADNTIALVQGHDHPALFSTCATVDEMRWIGGAPAVDGAGAFHCRAQHRYRQRAAACRVVVDGGACRVHFSAPQRAVTPGQSMVFYDGELCLGGGVIGGAR